jgi:hypothetical protein
VFDVWMVSKKSSQFIPKGRVVLRSSSTDRVRCCYGPKRLLNIFKYWKVNDVGHGLLCRWDLFRLRRVPGTIVLPRNSFFIVSGMKTAFWLIAVEVPIIHLNGGDQISFRFRVKSVCRNTPSMSSDYVCELTIRLRRWKNIMIIKRA